MRISNKITNRLENESAARKFEQLINYASTTLHKGGKATSLLIFILLMLALMMVLIILLLLCLTKGVAYLYAVFRPTEVCLIESALLCASLLCCAISYQHLLE